MCKLCGGRIDERWRAFGISGFEFTRLIIIAVVIIMEKFPSRQALTRRVFGDASQPEILNSLRRIVI